MTVTEPGASTEADAPNEATAQRRPLIAAVRRWAPTVGHVLVWIIVAIDAWFLWPAQLGGSTSMVIVSGVSMEPQFFDCDLVIARRIEPSVGDVIVYSPEELGGSQIVHRIVGGNGVDGWKVKGDNNSMIDPFTPTASEVRGVVLVHYDGFGRVSALLLSPVVWAIIILAAVAMLLWRPGHGLSLARSKGKRDKDGPEARVEG